MDFGVLFSFFLNFFLYRVWRQRKTLWDLEIDKDCSERPSFLPPSTPFPFPLSFLLFCIFLSSKPNPRLLLQTRETDTRETVEEVEGTVFNFTRKTKIRIVDYHVFLYTFDFIRLLYHIEGTLIGFPKITYDSIFHGFKGLRQ